MKTAIFQATILLLWSCFATSAQPGELVPEVLEDTGVAFVVLTNQENSIDRQSRVYQRVVGKLQRQFRNSDVLTFNAVILEEHQPDWSEGSSAISYVLDKINNPYVDTIVFVTGFVQPAASASQSKVSVRLELQLYDVSSGSVYMTLNEAGLAGSVTNGTDDLLAELSYQIDDLLVQLTEDVSTRTIELIKTQYEAPAQIIASRNL